MRRILQMAAVIVVVLASPALRLAGSPLRSGQAPSTPVLVELFTSEGCSDCPPADVILEKLIATQPIAGAEVIGLGQHVDYWDQQGWKDRFSSAALTNRQHIYGASFALESVYTPQIIVDGRAQFVGSDANAVRKAIERAIASPHGVIAIDVGRPFEGRQNGDGRSVALQVSVRDLPSVGRA